MKVSWHFCLIVIVCAAAWQAESLKILGVFPMAAKSHYILGSRLMVELASRGHEVTVINPFGEKNAPKTYTDILLTGFLDMHKEDKQNLFGMEDMSIPVMMLFMNFMGSMIAEKTFEHPEVQKLLNSKTAKFDVVIVEQFVNDAHKGFCYHFNAPCIAFSTIGSNAWVNHLVGNPAPTSYIPDIFLSYSSKMNFFQRLHNTAVSIFSYLNRKLVFMPKQNAILQKYIPNAPHVDELNNNVSLVLLNSHVSTNEPLPHVPNMIEIGGFHLSPPKDLPKDLKAFLDAAKEGVVYFSMGSNLQSKDLPAEKRDAILKAFSKLKQKVLWKWEDDVLPGQPSNVKLGKWLPQQEILAHPNVKLFITHGGLLSTTETIYNGKPIIAIPIFGDQKMNAMTAEVNGFGITIPYKELNEDKLTAALDKLLKDPSYFENAQRRSRIMHDQPVKPIDSAVYWVEYVARHKGAPHFKSAAVDLTWYQYYLIDILVFVGGFALVILYVSCKLFRKVCHRKSDAKKIDIKKKRK